MVKNRFAAGRYCSWDWIACSHSEELAQKQMNPKKIALGMIIASFGFLALAFLTGCTTLGVSLETDYGRLTYELPEPKGTKK